MVQLDYGGFDPSFIGVTLRFSSSKAWTTFEASRRTDSPLDLANRQGEDAFEALAVTSVVSHEVRHFHDFLLTPYSSRVFKLRVKALIYVVQALPFLVEGEGNCFPVPIPRWCCLTEAERLREISFLPPRPDGLPWRPIDLPLMQGIDLAGPRQGRLDSQSRDDVVRQILQRVMEIEEQIGQLTFNPETVGQRSSFQPWQILELSGILVQIQDLWQTYGLDHTQLFVDHLSSAKGNPYSTLLSLVAEMWSRGGSPLDWIGASAVATWSLLGSYEKDGWRACPTVRFIRLWRYLSENGLPRTSFDVVSLLELWSARLGLSSVADGLNETRKTFSQLVTLLERFERQSPPGSLLSTGYIPLLLRVAGGVAKASGHMIDRFLANPADYVNPRKYLESADQFVNPALRVMFEGGGITIPGCSTLKDAVRDLELRQHLVQWAADSPAGYVIASMIAPYALSDYAFVERGDVAELGTLIGLADFLFADSARARFDVQQAGRAFFGEAGIVPVEVQTRRVLVNRAEAGEAPPSL